MTRILIADDHDVVRSGLRLILEGREGWQVVAEASNGKEAVAQALEVQPDVAILDFQLPVMSGIEATRQIRAATAAHRDPDLHHARQRPAGRRAAPGRGARAIC